MKKKENGTNRIKVPWPTKDAMTQVYKMKLWGGDTSEFYSGEGSHNPEITEPYLKVITSFLSGFECPLSVCDLGCGDFNVGKNLVTHTKNYVAVDIVPDLIKRNTEKFKFPNLKFQCLDISEDALPSGNCAILRQVLQHLSNAEVLKISEKLHAYQYVILTEHLPNTDFIPNKDIISGQGIRLKKQSGINLLLPPFNMKVKEAINVLSIPVNHGQEKMLTTRYKMF